MTRRGVARRPLAALASMFLLATALQATIAAPAAHAKPYCFSSPNEWIATVDIDANTFNIVDDAVPAKLGTHTVTLASQGLFGNDWYEGGGGGTVKLWSSGAIDFTAFLWDPPAHGSVTINADGTYSYTRNSGYYGADAFTYVARSDADKVCRGPALVTVAPYSLELTRTGTQPTQNLTNEQPFTKLGPGVLGGWTDPAGFGVYSTIPAGSDVGNIILGGDLELYWDGTYVFTPTRKPNGTVGVPPNTKPNLGFWFRICRVVAPNVESSCKFVFQAFTLADFITHKPDAYLTAANTALNVTDPAKGVVANDISDLTGPVETGAGAWFDHAEVVTNPANGTLSLNTNGTFLYTPNPGFSGTDQFTYRSVGINNTRIGTPATATITVSPPPDTTAPTGSFSTFGVTPTGGSPGNEKYLAADVGGVNAALHMVASATDNAGGSGISSGQCTDSGPGGGTRLVIFGSAINYYLDEGTHPISCQWFDYKGNSTTVSQTFRVATHEPLVTFDLEPAPTGGTPENRWWNANDLGGSFFYPDGPYVTGTVSATAQTGTSIQIDCTQYPGSSHYSTSSASATTSMDLPEMGEGYWIQTCTATDAEGNTSEPDTVNLQVDTHAPTIDIHATAGATGGTSTVPWFSASDLGGQGQELQLKVRACDTCERLDTNHLYFIERWSGFASQSCTIDAGAPLTSIETPLPVDVPEGVHQVSCSATDVAGNVRNVLSEVYRIDTTAPTLTAVTKPVNTTNPILVTLSEPVSAESAASFSVVDDDGTPLAVKSSCAIAVTSDGLCSKWKLAHGMPLVPGQTYDVSLSPAGARLRDLAGNPMETDDGTFRAATTIGIADPTFEQDWATVNAAGTYGGDYVRDPGPGSSFSYTFTGTSVTWYTLTGPSQGRAQVDVTNPGGAPVSMVVDNYSAATVKKVANTINGLTNRTHTITITPLHTKNAASSDFFVVVDAIKIGTGPVVNTPTGMMRWGTLPGGPTSTYARSDQKGASFSMTFRGTKLQAKFRKGPNAPFVTVMVDGVVTSSIDLYAASATFPTAFTTLASGLSDDVHTVTVTISNTKNPLSTGFEVGVAQLKVT